MTVTERALRAIAEPPTQEDYLAHLAVLNMITQIGAIQERDRRECRAPQQEKD